MSKSILIALAMACGSGVAAQDTDTESEFAEVFSSTFISGGDMESTYLVGLSLLAGLDGDWFPASRLFPDGTYDAELAQRACAARVLRIARDGRFGFQATTIRSGESTSHVTHYRFAGGYTFSASTDLEGLFGMLLPENASEQMIVSQVLAQAGQSRHNGYVIVQRPAPDHLVLLPVAGNPEIWSRCP